MVRRCSDKLAKLLMVIFNGVFLICGIGVLALGLSGVSIDNNLKQIIHGLSVVNVVVIVVGAIIFLVSFMGFCGAWRESSCLITSFMICMIVILIAEIAVVSMAFSNRHELKGIVEKEMRKSLEKRNTTLIKEAWDDIEITLKCCGADGPADYNHDFPLSCCKERVGVCNEQVRTFSKDGCIGKIEDFLKSEYLGFGVAAIVVAFIEVVGIIFSCCLRSAINERYETV